MKKTLVLLALLFAVSVYAQDEFELIEKVEAQPGKVIIPYSKYKLKSNDLTLIIHEDHSDPVVHVQVAYHIGSARESVRNSGFAHFFEHMMFQGSGNVDDEEHFSIINGSGGTNNAFTSFDKTVYINTAPSNMTETMLWLEADRMGTHLDGFTKKKFENQRNAVKNEKRQRYDNQPYGMVNEVLFQTLYKDHPYEWTPIGYVDDLDIASYEDLRNFFLRWYGPNNATLVVSGDVDPAEVMAWVSKYYGTINKCPDVRDERARNPILNQDYYVTIKDYIRAPLTVMAIPTVPEFHEDEAALDVLAQIIGGGQSSILYKNLVKTEKALSANAGHNALELSGFFGIQILTLPKQFGGLGASEAVDAIKQAMKDFEKQGVNDDVFEVVKSQSLRSAYGTLNSVSSKALALSHYHMMKGNGYNLQDDIDRYEKLTKQDVIDAYNKYIKGKSAVIVRVEPDEERRPVDEEPPSRSVNPHANEAKKVDRQYVGLEYNPPKDNFDRSVQPTASEPKAATTPSFFVSSLDNGLKVIGSQSNEAPLVYMYFTIDGGHLLEANKKVKTGVAALTAIMMEKGTKNLNSEEFSRSLEKLGSSISFSSGMDATTIFVSSLKENLDATLKLLEDALFNPLFDEEEFKRERKRLADNVDISMKQPGTMMSLAWNRIFYGGTILEELATGTNADIYKIKIKDVIEFYNTYYVANKTKLAIVGDISQDEAMNSIQFLSKWKQGSFDIPALPSFKDPGKTKIYLVDKPYASQSTIWIGHMSNTYDYNGTYFKSTVMNYALGGAFNSRINLNLREDKGFTYGARSYFSGNNYYGYYRFSSEIRKNATDSAISEVMYEINNFVKNGITQEELDFTKNSLILSQALNYESPFQKLIFLSNMLEYDLPADYVDQQTAIIQNMTVEEVNKLAQENLRPEGLVIIVVGHAYKIREGLEALGYEVEVITVN